MCGMVIIVSIRQSYFGEVFPASTKRKNPMGKKAKIKFDLVKPRSMATAPPVALDVPLVASTTR